MESLCNRFPNQLDTVALEFVDFQGGAIDIQRDYIHPLPHLSDNLKFAPDMKYKNLSVHNFLAPILCSAMVALGGAIPDSISASQSIR